MPQSVVTTSRLCLALLAAALFAAPSGLQAQGRADAGSRGESVVITVPSVRVRTAPSISSLSIDDFAQGSVFPLADEDYQTKEWLGVIVDGRIAFVPRYAVAVRQRSGAPTSANAQPASRTVMQAGAPSPASAPAVATRPRAADRAPAPVAQAPVEELAAAPTQAAAPAARTAPAPAPATAMRAEPAPSAAPPAAPSPALATTAERAEPAAERPPSPAVAPAAEAPVFKTRRPGVNLTAGVLGSATVIETFGLPRTVHVTGASFVGIRYRMLGLYAAPEMGQGGGFRSTSLDGGASLQLINLHLLRITALGGYLRHSETTVPEDSAVMPVTRSLEGYTMGGMVSVPFVGPLRLAYRGQYDTVRDAGIPVHRVKHSVGLVF
jgi:hypothetical protein